MNIQASFREKKKAYKKIVPILSVLASALTPFASHAATYAFVDLFGDTAYVADVNNKGDIVLSGFMDSDGIARIVSISEKTGSFSPDWDWDFVPGLEGYESSEVVDINDQGGMKGFVFSFMNPSRRMPVVWQDGVAYDTGDPANSGVEYFDDSPVSRRNDVLDLSLMNIIDAPSCVDSDGRDGMPCTSTDWFKTDQGLIVFAYQLGPWDSWGALVPIAVPAPGTLPLLGVALWGLAALGGRRSLIS